ncbi:MAG: glucosylceramidase [Maribacter sp.]|nr:glucosylceramidase [Maribacter sp.]
MTVRRYHRLSTLALFLLLIIFFGCGESADPVDQRPSANLYVTTLDQQSLLEKQPVTSSGVKPIGTTISIDTTQVYQQMDGFGFTLTGGSALHLQKMSEDTRHKLLQELFGRDSNQIGINYLRISVGASDLDEAPWSYNDLANGETDVQLEKFSLAYDTLYLIPTLKEILKISPKIQIMASPWSPPKWMKDNNDTRGGSLKMEYHDVYAHYLTTYIGAMKSEGITIDALTIQNEPLHPGNNPSLLMLEDQQAEFIKNSLGPAFEKKDISTKIVVYDHNADRPDYPISILNDPEVAKYIDGSAFHLYGGTINALSEVHKAHPNKNLYFTEQWIGAPGDFAKDFSWHIENLIIGASRNWCKTVLEWNLANDENQDPHTDRGGCDRCLGAITITGDQITRNPAYYIVAQASKFVPSGSHRIASNLVENIPNVAFKTPQGEKVVLIQNKTEEESKVYVQLGKESYAVTLKSGSVGTLVIP